MKKKEKRKPRTKILLVDDQKMVRLGVACMLKGVGRKNGLSFSFSEAESAEEAIAKAQRTFYDLILMDYALPKMSGPEAVKILIALNPKLKILALSGYIRSEYIDRMMRAGVKGYVLKTISADELILAIMAVLDNKKYYSHEVAMLAIESSKDLQSAYTLQLERKKNLERLSDREKEILKFISQGYTNELIGKTLQISKRTVDTHRQNLLLKLNVRKTAGLVSLAMDMELVQKDFRLNKKD
jgi:DNA-binding NarL/FixJ family response regulator